MDGGLLVGYARCSTDEQDVATQREALARLGVPQGRVYVDHGRTGTTLDRPGLRQALAAVGPGLRRGAPKLSASPHRHLVELHTAGRHTGAELAELFGVARSSVYQAIARSSR